MLTDTLIVIVVGRSLKRSTSRAAKHRHLAEYRHGELMEPTIDAVRGYERDYLPLCADTHARRS